ncbi:DUF2059 domain-containing protein [Terrimonas sp. NA20]|uniref:DUF2059 domain-containing protein n=1 Tax=Terrimonas ginsenosidimutans TaxID=2908004 RepID=A0ABS9KUN2_9BACT|nr:DUF2059 domain-containing protein [Terrimonas ginsenosidimutans]MCG2616016.1 DUF2059 domain-containing protein [Terrimonas ginsenosidimutans]
MRKVVFLLLFILPVTAFSQIDTAFLQRLKAMESGDMLKTDTIPPPNDAFTRKIKKLREEKSGLNIELVIQIKIKEEQEKDKSRPHEYYDRLLEEMNTGETGRLLENCLVNMYRESYTEKEIGQLRKFYKTSAGKKMNTEFILLIARSVKDAEQLMKIAMTKLDRKKASPQNH